MAASEDEISGEMLKASDYNSLPHMSSLFNEISLHYFPLKEWGSYVIFKLQKKSGPFRM